MTAMEEAVLFLLDTVAKNHHDPDVHYGAERHAEAVRSESSDNQDKEAAADRIDPDPNHAKAGEWTRG